MQLYFFIKSGPCPDKNQCFYSLSPNWQGLLRRLISGTKPSTLKNLPKTRRLGSSTKGDRDTTRTSKYSRSIFVSPHHGSPTSHISADATYDGKATKDDEDDQGYYTLQRDNPRPTHSATLTTTGRSPPERPICFYCIQRWLMFLSHTLRYSPISMPQSFHCPTPS